MKFSKEVISHLKENTRYDTFEQMPTDHLRNYLDDLKSDHELCKDLWPDWFVQDISEIKQFLDEV